MTDSKPKPPGSTTPRQQPEGKTTTRVRDETRQDTPRMPNEHDESSDSQASAEPSQRRMGHIAQEDLEHGRVDTDKGPAIQEAYDKTRKSSDQPEKDFSPGGRGASRR
jgi:hypothetical protein